MLARGYAYAATDKGNVGATFYRDGAAAGRRGRRVERPGHPAHPSRPRRPSRDGTGARRAARTPPGISNGGYLVRWQLENHPELYDGGVDWEGTLWRADGPNLLTYLPPLLQNYPAYEAAMTRPRTPRCSTPASRRARSSCGPTTSSVYWDLTQRIYREEFDPAYDGATRGGHPVLRERHPRAATPTTTTPPGRAQCTAPCPASR